MSDQDVIIGIDLGTTNSEVAALVDGRPKVLGPGDTQILPSCVGFSPAGELLIGQAARNQLLVYPERTVRSVKRKMGTDEKLPLADKTFAPQEISALILKELVRWAQEALNRPVRKAVITVPAYFSDAQRQATREAGELAGLEVVRILNEPTAASLAYGPGEQSHRTVMVYDLGGGTFDVSIVSMEADVTEVLASHGNTHLGGDDLDDLLLERLLQVFRKEHGIDLKDRHPASYSRLRWAAEEAKKRLSFEPYARIREESLAVVDGRPLHLDLELSREEYEDMIRPLIESTLDSVFQAMKDASKEPKDLDVILLVGGSTRIPLVRRILEERVGVPVRQDVHPELCVALGAGLLAARLAGHSIERVLVDVSPYSFGPSYLGTVHGVSYPFCYRPIIPRNTPLPVTRTERYYTASPNQKAVEISIFQGDDPDALKDILVGNFRVEGLTRMQDYNEVLCRMSLDLDGILRVEAIEKCTGRSRHITIHNATRAKGEQELARARQRLADLYQKGLGQFGPVLDADDEATEEDAVEVLDSADKADPQVTPHSDPGFETQRAEAERLTTRSRGLLEQVHDEDKEEIVDLHDRIREAIEIRDIPSLSGAVKQLRELLFFIEGRP